MSHTCTPRQQLRRFAALHAFIVALAMAPVAPAWAQCPIDADEFTPDPEFTSDFLIEHCRFKDRGRTPFLNLKPGWQITLESDEEVQVITVLDETKEVNGVITRVVEEFESERDGDELIPVERSLNYFAICRPTNTVFYFGEDVEDFDEEGNVISSEGEWLAGRNGARPGVIMPGMAFVGAGYYEEIAPEDEALDKARIVSITRDCEADDFDFEGRACITTENTSDCGNDEEEKRYVDGVGIIQDEDLVITDYGYIPKEDEGD